MPARIQACRDELARLGWRAHDQSRSAGWEVIATRDSSSLLFFASDLYVAWSGAAKRALTMDPHADEKR